MHRQPAAAAETIRNTFCPEVCFCLRLCFCPAAGFFREIDFRPADGYLVKADFFFREASPVFLLSFFVLMVFYPFVLPCSKVL